MSNPIEPSRIQPSRRALFGAGAALLAAGGCVTASNGAPTDQDAHLIALCDEYHRLHDVAHAPDAPDSSGWDKANEKSWEIAREVADIPAVSEAGRRAKAKVAARLFAVQDRGDHDCQIVLAVLRDIAGAPA